MPVILSSTLRTGSHVARQWCAHPLVIAALRSGAQHRSILLPFRTVARLRPRDGVGDFVEQRVAHLPFRVEDGEGS